MRIRRKKHLDERLKAVSEFFIVADKQLINVNEALRDKKYFDFKKIFGNNNDVEIEIGCGKGAFIAELAKLNPNINYAAVEMMENIVLTAAERISAENLRNVRFINSGAEYLPRYIADGVISSVYLNFSPPYPKNSNENKRLTNKKYVNMYKNMLKSGGTVYQKTDDAEFFEYSLKNFVDAGFRVENKSYASETEKPFNVKSEYEKKYRLEGKNIFVLRADKI